MKRFVCLLVAAAFVVGGASMTGPSAASAAPPETVKTDKRATKKAVKEEFVDFGQWVINGEIKKPSSTWVGADQRPDFRRLLRLKRSFMGELHKTAKEIRRL